MAIIIWYILSCQQFLNWALGVPVWQLRQRWQPADSWKAGCQLPACWLLIEEGAFQRWSEWCPEHVFWGRQQSRANEWAAVFALAACDDISAFLCGHHQHWAESKTPSEVNMVVTRNANCNQSFLFWLVLKDTGFVLVWFCVNTTHLCLCKTSNNILGLCYKWTMGNEIGQLR